MPPLRSSASRAPRPANGLGDGAVRWHDHLQDEVDAAYLYRSLARIERDAGRRELFGRLVAVEEEHADRWRRLLADAGEKVSASQPPSLRARALCWLARCFGPGLVAPSLLAEETHEVKRYLLLARDMPESPVRDVVSGIARDSAEHASALARMLDKTGEPWHAVGSGGVMRSVVYGFNDGLTANFGLVAGVLGANVQPEALRVAGLAGMIADALSMGASGFLAAKSQAEVYEHEIGLEREEIRLMPDLEAKELALIYEAKGLKPTHARDVATSMLENPDKMLEEKVREELGIGRAGMSPLKDGIVTGIATAVGALIPVLPFLLLPFERAIWASFAISMAAHFAVGAARSLFTGRGIFRSGLDMFVVGLGVAAIGYAIGDLLQRFLLK